MSLVQHEKILLDLLQKKCLQESLEEHHHQSPIECQHFAIYQESKK